MADTPTVTKSGLQDTTLDVRLPSQSPSHDHHETTALDIRSDDTLMAVYDSKYGLSQAADVAGRFEDSTKMYICHLCDFRTAFRNSLLNHQAVHSDIRPWVCAVCEYAAKRKQDLKKHLHTIHGLMVDSTMLKPVDLPGSNSSVTPGSLSRGESGEDNSWDDVKANKMSHMDYVHPDSHFLQPMTDVSQNMTASHVMAPTDMLAVSIKQEKLELTNQKPLPSMSNFISSSLPESDSDLPVSFTSGCISKDGRTNTSQITSKSSESLLHSNRIQNLSLDRNKSTKDSKLSLVHLKPTSDGDLLPQGYSTHTRKRHRNYSMDSHTYSDIPQEHPTPPQMKSAKIVDSDSLPCSSSVVVSHTHGNQTQSCFMCEFCDIMFFQRAMYLMHAGLHSPENPWRCAVCANIFTEKYSFTSHFINQH